MEGGERDEKDRDFAELLNRSLASTRRMDRGEMVEARVLEVTSEWVYLDIGGKSEGVIHRSEFSEDGVKKGDRVRAYYLGHQEGGQLFTTKITDPEISKTFLRDAWETGIPIQGTVEREVKGGYEVRIPGGIRGFCPFSQMERGFNLRDENRQDKKTLEFKIVEYNQDRNRVVLSRKAIIEEEEARRWEELKEKISVGKRMRGKVTAVKEFGALLDIGGIQGLIPLSELGWGNPKELLDRLTPGDEVQACVMEVDWQKRRIVFSLKKTLPDPWEKVADSYPEGSVHKGRVTRIEPFGAFVELEPGVEGLIHISKLGAQKRIKSPRDVVGEGEELLVKIESLDPNKRRLSLSFAGRAEEAEGVTEEEMRGYSTEPRAKPTIGDLIRQKMAEKGK